MNLSELLADFERRRDEAVRHNASAPLATVYSLILDELRAVDGEPIPDRMMSTSEAATVLALAPRTVARWASQGRFDGARKTSADGEWRLPAKSVYEQARGGNGRERTEIPRLWAASE